MIYIYGPNINARKAIAGYLRSMGDSVSVGYETGGPRDLVVNWGHCSRVGLNANIQYNKYRELEMLAAGGVDCPRYSRHRPSSGRWYARTLAHEAGKDLEANLRTGDYYVEHVDTVQEFRVHIFNGRAMTAATKIPKDGAHPVFRTHRLGWRFVYGGAESARGYPAAREAAIRAVRAVHYDFGAVDVAIRPDGRAVVWEVNSAPGLEGATAWSYAQAIHDYHRDRPRIP